MRKIIELRTNETKTVVGGRLEAATATSTTTYSTAAVVSVSSNSTLYSSAKRY